MVSSNNRLGKCNISEVKNYKAWIFCVPHHKKEQKTSANVHLTDIRFRKFATVPKIGSCRGDNPLYSVLVPNIFGSHIHFLVYWVMLPEITGYSRDIPSEYSTRMGGFIEMGMGLSRGYSYTQWPLGKPRENQCTVPKAVGNYPFKRVI
jgi:hypothetical protein